MVKRITDVKVGDPMGFKLLEEDCRPDTLDKVLDALEVYHGGKYIVGKDVNCGLVGKPHYHIHWFSVKDVKEGALKTFRSSLGKKIPELTKGSRLGTGQDLPSADPNSWLGYAIKETQVKVSGYSITDEILVHAQSHLQLKAMKKVHGEKLQNQKKEKQEFKDKLLAYVKEELPRYEIPSVHLNNFKSSDYTKIKLLVIKYLKESQREGSLKRGLIDTYVMYCAIHILHWDEYSIANYVYGSYL